MINAKELRVGNLVLAGIMTEPTSVLTIDYQTREGFVINKSIPIADLHPIPLTEDILLACGFKDLKGEFCPYYTLEQFELEIVDRRYMLRLRWEEGGASLWLANVQSLHHLQNIYHSLAGKELIYSPK